MNLTAVNIFIYFVTASFVPVFHDDRGDEWGNKAD